MTDDLADWLIDSDPALAWQVERDLVGASAEIWQTTRSRVPTEGFGAVLDLEMPPADGLRAAEEIRDDPGTNVVLVTRHARPGVLRRALGAGVAGFVPKTTPAEQLAEILRGVAAGHRYVDPEIAASALTENECPLTDRELDVVRAARTGDSVKAIADQVHLAPGTVRNYLSSAMTKLGVSSRHAAAYRAWEEGWI